MTRWKVPMPATKPDEGKTHVVIASGRRGGSRLEFVGQLDDEQVRKIWEIALPAMKKSLEQKS